MIEKGGPVAPWKQLADLIRSQIEDGTLPPGARLPSINDLRQTHDLSIKTVQKTFAALKSEGLIVTSPMGTFVRRSDD